MLIFVSSQPRAASLAEELVISGTPNVDCLHAGLSKKEREDAVSRMRRGESWVMVSTEVMARGMDFKGVREVINYDFPQTVQSYVHRIGQPLALLACCLASLLMLWQVVPDALGEKERRSPTSQIRTARGSKRKLDLFAPSLGHLTCVSRIANVLLQSGSPVPEWILKLPKPSKMKRKQMGKVKRAETVNNARHIGRKDAIKKRRVVPCRLSRKDQCADPICRDMIAGSKRRREKDQQRKEKAAAAPAPSSADDVAGDSS